MAQIETENNAYKMFWNDQQRVLWYVMVFSVVVNCFFWRSRCRRRGRILGSLLNPFSEP